MKRTTAIFFLSIYMLAFAEFHHFEEHKQLDPSISFLSFLRLHYVGEIVIDDDYQRDNELPFREADCCIATITLSCECPVLTFDVTKSTEEITNEFILYDEDNHSLLSAADIFQPPRTA